MVSRLAKIAYFGKNAAGKGKVVRGGLAGRRLSRIGFICLVRWPDSRRDRSDFWMIDRDKRKFDLHRKPGASLS
jgi:hypothetical protein